MALRHESETGVATHSRKLRIQESEGKSDQGSRPLPLPLICNLVNSGFHRTTFKHLMKGKDLLALFCSFVSRPLSATRGVVTARTPPW